MISLSIANSKTVRDCYDLLNLSPAGGVEDFTEGIYEGDPDRSYLEAQRLKNEYLLDEVECRQGSRILDIGCGYGTLLEAARRRGAAGVGITISEPQLKRCRAKGLDAHLMNYRSIPREWDSRFDGIVASGSIEHFVQAREAAAGLQLQVYREFFEICHRILSSGSRKLVTAVIVSSGRPALRPPCSGKPGAVTVSAHRPRRNLEGGA